MPDIISTFYSGVIFVIVNMWSWEGEENASIFVTYPHLESELSSAVNS
jgi:hypothetical protein